jgi:hypothetical protein
MMLPETPALQSWLFGPRRGKRPFRKSSQGYRRRVEVLEGRCNPSVTVLAPGFDVTTSPPLPASALS